MVNGLSILQCLEETTTVLKSLLDLIGVLTVTHIM